MIKTIALAACGTLVAASAADATSSADMYWGDSKGPGYVSFVGGPGTADLSALHVAQGNGGWRLSNPAGITGSSYCVTDTPLSVMCLSYDLRLDVRAGLGGGSITVATEPGTTASTHVTGGPGNDAIAAGPGVGSTVELSGGMDSVSGNPGQTAISIPSSFQDQAVDVDLTTGSVRHGADVTTINGSASVFAFAPATIRGTVGADHLYAKRGEIASGDGNDALTGYGRFDSGSGDDLISIEGISRVTCGAGHDRVLTTNPGGALSGDCEHVVAFGGKYEITDSWVDPRPHRVRGRPGKLRVKVFCGAKHETKTCRGTLHLRVGRSQRSTRFSVARRSVRWVELSTPRWQHLAVGTRVAASLTIPVLRDAEWSAPIVR